MEDIELYTLIVVAVVVVLVILTYIINAHCKSIKVDTYNDSSSELSSVNSNKEDGKIILEIQDIV